MRRRNTVFDRGWEQGLRVEDDRYRALHLGPDRGAAIGEYAATDSAEFSDSYYAPGDDYPRGSETVPVGGVTRGAHRGRGPKGYKRTDARLLEDICERLTDDPRVDAGELSVEVHEGTVSLTGTVPDKRTKWLVEDIVVSVSGVNEVDNRLRCSPGS